MPQIELKMAYSKWCETWSSNFFFHAFFKVLDAYFYGLLVGFSSPKSEPIKVKKKKNSHICLYKILQLQEKNVH